MSIMPHVFTMAALFAVTVDAADLARFLRDVEGCGEPPYLPESLNDPLNPAECPDTENPSGSTGFGGGYYGGIATTTCTLREKICRRICKAGPSCSCGQSYEIGASVEVTLEAPDFSFLFIQFGGITFTFEASFKCEAAACERCKFYGCMKKTTSTYDCSTSYSDSTGGSGTHTNVIIKTKSRLDGVTKKCLEDKSCGDHCCTTSSTTHTTQTTAVTTTKKPTSTAPATEATETTAGDGVITTTSAKKETDSPPKVTEPDGRTQVDTSKSKTDRTASGTMLSRTDPHRRAQAAGPPVGAIPMESVVTTEVDTDDGYDAMWHAPILCALIFDIQEDMASDPTISSGVVLFKGGPAGAVVFGVSKGGITSVDCSNFTSIGP